MSNETNNNDKKILRMNLCDPDTYKQIMTDCLDPSDLEKMNVNHFTNAMALFAESLITYVPRIADLMESSNAVEYTINVKHSSDKDTLKMKSKPVSAIDDTFTATCEDPEQSTMDFKNSDEQESAANDDEDDIPTGTKALPGPSGEPLRISMSDVVDAEIVDEEGGEDE